VEGEEKRIKAKATKNTCLNLYAPLMQCRFTKILSLIIALGQSDINFAAVVFAGI